MFFFCVIKVGAGLSASSGLATFRGSGGLWHNYDAMNLATPDAFYNDPSLVWQFYSYRRHCALKAKPNNGHYALAEMARRRSPSEFLTLTQNVDGLSIRAEHPSDSLLCLHGDLFTVKCTSFMCNYKQEHVFDDPLTPALAVDENDDEEEYSDSDSDTNFSQPESPKQDGKSNKPLDKDTTESKPQPRTFPGLAQRYTDLLDKDLYYSSSGITDLDDSAYSSSSSAYFPNGYNMPIRKKKIDQMPTANEKDTATKTDKSDNGHKDTSHVDIQHTSTTKEPVKQKKKRNLKKTKKFVKKNIPLEQLPRCPKCKVGLLRPGIVWFGETLPFEVLQKADDFITKGPNSDISVPSPSSTSSASSKSSSSSSCSSLDFNSKAQPTVDLIMVIGTSGNVWPAAGYVEQVALRGGKVAVFNTDDQSEEAAFSDQMGSNGGWFFRGDAAELLPKALEPLIGKLRKKRKY